MNATEDINVYFKNKRDQYTVEIRKAKNDHFIQEKRRKLTEDSSSKTNFGRVQELSQLTTNFKKALEEQNFEQLADSAELIRRAISNDENPPLDRLIKTGIIPDIIQLLDHKYFDHHKLMMECAWIIANLASGTPEHVRYLVEHDIITKGMNLLKHPKEEVKDNTVWILANIAGDSFENRDILLEYGIVELLVNILHDGSFTIAFVSHVSWLVSNLCRGKPYPDYQLVAPFLKLVQFFMTGLEHEETLINCMWTLSYLSDGDDSQIKAVLDLGVMAKIIELTKSDKRQMIAPALRTLGNLVTGRDEFTAYILENGCLEAMTRMLDCNERMFRKEACWAISNIVAGASCHIDEVFKYNKGEIIHTLIGMVFQESIDVVREALFCLTNICSEGSHQHLQILIDLEIIELFVRTLEAVNESLLIKVILEALENILDYGKHISSREHEQNVCLMKLAQSGGFAIIEGLQNNPDNDVYTVVSRLIEDHFDYE